MTIMAWVMSMVMAGTTIGTINQRSIEEGLNTYAHSIAEVITDMKTNSTHHYCILVVEGKTIGLESFGDGYSMDYVMCGVSE